MKMMDVRRKAREVTVATHHTDKLCERHLQADSHPLAVVGSRSDELAVAIFT